MGSKIWNFNNHATKHCCTTFKLSLMMFASCSEPPKSVAFLTSIIFFSISFGVLLGLLHGFLDLNLRPAVPASLNLFTTRCN